MALPKLVGADISPDYQTLIAADADATESQSWVFLVNLDTGESTRVTTPNAAHEAGTYSVAFAGDGSALVSSAYNGSGQVALRRYDPATKSLGLVPMDPQATDTHNVGTCVQLWGKAMLAPNAYRDTIASCEPSNSGGPYGYYDVATKAVHRTPIARRGTGADVWEIAATPDGEQFCIPTYTGTHIVSGELQKLRVLDRIGQQAPLGVTYHPVAPLLFLSWRDGRTVTAHETQECKVVGSFDFGASFGNPGNVAYKQGRLRFSADGSTLFCTTPGGVGFLRLCKSLTALDQTVQTPGTPVQVRLMATVGDQEAPGYRVAQPPANGTITGDPPKVTYTPNKGFRGEDTFTFQACYGPAWSKPGIVTVNVGGEAAAGGKEDEEE